MRTYKAELAPWRIVPLHPNYVEAAVAHADRMMRPGPRVHANETTCPYCGEKGNMLGTIRVGAKEQVENIPMTPQGYEVSDSRDRDTEILIIHCMNEHVHPQTGETGPAAIDALAYLSPAVFFADKENKSLFPDI